jgi:DNA-binding SARP family transcriptional activator
MSRTSIRLLGPPRIEVDGGVRVLPGWKPWGLLAYLVLADRPPTRSELAELLWPTADDPAAALRWALHQARRALGDAVAIVGRDGRLAFDAAAASIDVLELLEGDLDPEQVEDLVRGDLLEGTHFADSPSFDLWLGMERARIGSATRSTLRWAATLSLADDADRALRLVERLLTSDPFDDAAHELAIEIQVARGDRRAARAHLDRVARLYRVELGTDPPARLHRPLERVEPDGENPLVDRRTSARATLTLARARLTTGDYDAAIASSRRASTDAAVVGDAILEAESLLVLAEGLIHGRRGSDREAVGLLDRALRLAMGAEAFDLAADIERESGYVSFLAGDYGAAEVALHRSLALAERSGDAGRMGRALTILAACRSDEAALDEAEGLLGRAIGNLEANGDRRWLAYARSYLARVHLARGRSVDAAATAQEAIEGARESGWHALVPFPLTFRGEAALMAGDPAGARTIFGEALTMAQAMDDPCWEALSLRGLARIETAEGRAEEGRDLLGHALDSCRRYPDTYRWAEIVILTELVEAERGSDPEHREAARRLAGAAGLTGLVERIDVASARQTRGQTPRP